MTLDSPQQCIHTLRMLSRNPQIARHVQTLVVRPDHAEQTPRTRYTPFDGSVISGIVRQAAAHLDALHTFVWDAEELPPDNMWLSLLMS